MNPNSILGKYLIKQIIFSFIGVLLLVLGIVFMFEIIELLRKVSNRTDINFMFVLKMALSKLPRTIELIFPFVMMIAAMISFWKVSKSNEFVIIRASGVSIWGFLRPVLIATFAIGVINVAAINPVSSYLYEYYETLEFRLKTKNPNAMLFTDMGLWIRESDEKDSFVVLQARNIRQEDDGGLFLKEVSVLEMDRKSQILRRIESAMGMLESGAKTFSLKDVKIYSSGKPTQALPSLNYKTTLTIDRIKESFVDPEAISVWKLPSLIKFYEKSGFSVQKHYMRYLSLLVSPFLLCSMVLVAAVFALQANNRKGGVLYLIIGGICAGFVVYFFSQVIYAFGMNGYIPAILAVLTPTLVVSMVAISLLLHLEDG
jgi:lipopolysaccharide export system permease protein